MMVMADLMVTVHLRLGWNSRGGEHGDGDDSEQNVPEHSHFLAPSGGTGRAF
jgi:hypothetical protein